MVVGADGVLPLPWLAQPLAGALATQRGHALLLHAAPGAGALAFALTLAQAWLCEGGLRARSADADAAPGRHRSAPCGQCASCRMIQAHLHTDLLVLLPENLRREHGWPLADDRVEGDDSKRKPSRQIRIGEVRGVLDWVSKTSARGQGKVVLMHPAEALNAQSANALLKTLEEPPPGTRVLLTATDPACLLPTVQSRCQQLRLPLPDVAQASDWLKAQQVEQPAILLAACSGLPLDALAMHLAGVSAAAWAELPAAIAAGRVAPLAGWPIARVLDALLKLCHDTLARTLGASGRYFPESSIKADADPVALSAWLQDLHRVARHIDHPWHEPLLLDTLVNSGARALAPMRAKRVTVARVGFDTLPA
jgi:DNA polymerase-3 subunit delta'